MSILDELITTHENGEPYGVDDLNRIGEAIIYVRDYLNENKYNITLKYPVRVDWSADEVFPTLGDLNNILANVETIRKTASVLPNMPRTPDSMVDMTAAKANDIERILQLTHEVAQAIIAAWYFVGELYAGEVV